MTDRHGRFEIKGLPHGSHTFRVWHERPGYLDRNWKVTVSGEKTAVPPVKISPAKLERPIAVP